MTVLADWAQQKAYGTHEHGDPQPTIAHVSEGIKSPRWLGWLVFFAYVAVGLVLDFRYGLIPRDAQSRVANAYYTLAGLAPHLASIGFIWNPLPSVLEIPLVALHGIIPMMVRYSVAGVIVSSAMSAIAVTMIFRIACLIGLTQRWSMSLAVAFALNPLILFFGSNGMSDVMLLAAMLGMTFHVMRYTITHRVRSLAAAGVWLAVGFGFRYEAVIYAVMAAIVLMVMESSRRRREDGKDASVLAIFGLPITYAGAAWVLINWAIMGNPLYFLDSSYGNAAQTSTGAYVNSAITFAHNNPLGALWFVVERMAIFPPLLFILIAIAMMWAWDAMPRLVAIPLVIAMADPVLQLILTTMGASSGQERFFIYYVPLAFILVAFIMIKTPSWGKLMILAALLAGNAGTAVVSYNAALGKGVSYSEHIIMSGQHVHSFVAANEINAYLAHHKSSLVLLDTFIGRHILIGSPNPSQFVTTSFPAFKKILAHPQGNVSYILVPEPQPHNVSLLDAVNRYYPTLWAKGAPWVKLILTVKSGNYWRLYQIVRPSNAHPATTGTLPPA